MLLLLACSEPLPDDADGRMHAAWDAWQAGDDRTLAQAISLMAETDGEGELTPLTETPGVMLVNPLPGCTLEQVEELVIALNQEDFFDVFNHYDREYTSSLEAWKEDREPLTWRSDYGFTVPLSGSAEATLLGEMRAPEEDMRVAVNVLAGPAVWENEGPVFDEDFRIEGWTLRDGVVVHVEGLWRHMDAGAYNTENDAVRDLVLNGLYDWDQQIVTHCEDGW